MAAHEADDSRPGLAESEEKYRLISEVISDYTFSSALNSEGKLFLNWVAGAFETITGYDYPEYVARGGWLAALHPDDLEQDARDMELLRQNKDVVTEVRTFTKTGELRWVRVYGHPVWDAERQELVGIYGAVQDVTERKLVEAEREALIHELEAKNAELERFAYTVSHDLKSPLITIRGFLGMLSKDLAEGRSDRLKGDIERTVAAADSMERLLHELLRLSRIGRVANPAERVPLAFVVRDAALVLRSQLDERGIRLLVDEPLPEVYGDRLRLVEVVQNLIENAVKFHAAEPDRWIRVGARPAVDGQPGVYFVADNGIGIEPRHHEKVFGLFEKLDTGAPGTGVGLALVRRIVEVHGGRVWIESAGRGGGTTVCFTLPAPSAG